MTQASVIANQMTKTSLMEKIRELEIEVGELQAQRDRYKRVLDMLPLKCPITGAIGCSYCAGSCGKCLDAWDGE